MNWCDYCTHVRYSRDGGSTYCGRSGKYKYICRFHPALDDCPSCGGKVKIGYACGEYFIMPKSGEGCKVCGHFTKMHSSEQQMTKTWDDAVSNMKSGKIPMPTA